MKCIPFLIIILTIPICALPVANINVTIKKQKSHIREEIQRIKKQVLREVQPSPIEYDTLLDINYDGKKDLVIGYEGMTGNGIKHCARTFVYNASSRTFIPIKLISDLVNPSFYTEKKMITSFYLAYGGGSGEQYNWLDGRWRVTKTFHVENHGDTSKWVIEYPLRKVRKIITAPYEGLPPKNILMTKVIN